MSKTGCFLLFLSAGIMRRPYVQVISKQLRGRPSAASYGELSWPPSLSFPRLRLRHDQFELRTAIELGKKIVLVHGESNKRHTSLLASRWTINRVTDARVPACSCVLSA